MIGVPGAGRGCESEGVSSGNGVRWDYVADVRLNPGRALHGDGDEVCSIETDRGMVRARVHHSGVNSYASVAQHAVPFDCDVAIGSHLAVIKCVEFHRERSAGVTGVSNAAAGTRDIRLFGDYEDKSVGAAA